MDTLQKMEKTYDEKVRDHQITKTKKTNGFVLDATVEEAGKHKTAKQAIRQQFLHHGVDPAAIMPAQLWRDICKTSGLYRFEHLKGDMATTWLQQINAFGLIMTILTYTLPALIFASMLRIDTHFNISLAVSSGRTAMAIIILTILYYVGHVIAINASDGTTHSAIASKCSRFWLRLLPRNVIFRQAFRGQGDCPDGMGYRLTCRISFPTPQSDHFLSMLDKARQMQQQNTPQNFNCCVAIEPSEIAWDPASIIDSHKQQEQEMLRRLKGDPILYCYANDKGDPNEYAVILAHEGQFPNEKKAMDMVYRTT